MIHTIERTQMLPISATAAWAFFSSPRNLPDITPPWLAFSLTSDPAETMYPGMILTYCLKPLMGVSHVLGVRDHPCSPAPFLRGRTAHRALPPLASSAFLSASHA